MTLVLATITSSGIVLTADSRQTYQNQKGVERIGSDSATKLFSLTDRIGVGISGSAFLEDKNGILKNAGWFVEQFKAQIKPEWSVKETAEALGKYLGDFFVEKNFKNLELQIKDVVKKEGGSDLKFKKRSNIFLPYSYDKNGKTVEQTGSINTINFIVAGIEKDRVGYAYSVAIPQGVIAENNTATNQGAVWVGQTDVLLRILKGYALEIFNLEFMSGDQKLTKKYAEQLGKLEYNINYAAMPLQDAIDFSILITRTTESVQRFSDGTQLSPGGTTGVGGGVDVAVITPEKGFVWIKKKELHAEGKTVDLDKFSDLK